MRRAISTAFAIIAIISAYNAEGLVEHREIRTYKTTPARIVDYIKIPAVVAPEKVVEATEVVVEAPEKVVEVPEVVVDPVVDPAEADGATPAEEPEPVEIPTLASERDIELIARTIIGEAHGVESKAEQAAVAWCVLNRVDAQGKTIEQIVLAPYQFAPRMSGNVSEYFWELAADVVHRWEAEHAGIEDVGRVLPAEYMYFTGDGRRNHFTTKWRGRDYWDWSLPDPYTQTA